MRILFLSDDFPPQSFGGAGISTYELAKGVLNAGHEVFVATLGRGQDYNLEGLKVFKVDCQYHERWRAYLSLYNPKAVRRVEEILKQIKPDIVHANNIHFYLSYHSLKLSKRYAKAVVITLRDAMSFSFGKLASLSWLDQLKQAKKRWNPFRNFMIKRYLKYADKIFAVSSALKQALGENGIRGAEVMHTGIDVSEYPYDANYGDKTVLFAGRLTEAKGSRVVEKVMELVKKEIPEAKLLTAGSGQRWLGREDMKDLYAKSSVVLVPSVCFDAFPRNVVEAQALARPVISTPYGGAKEAIEDGVTGFIISPFEADKMALKIVELLEDPQKARQFGEAGRKRIEAQFNLSDKISRLVSLYERFN